MKNFNTKDLRSAIKTYARPSNKLALFIFISDLIIYGLAIMGTIFLEDMMLRVSCAILAGLRIGTLFLVAHDAGHDSFTSNRLWNSIIGRIAFLPSFHNYSLWLIAHNRAHHQAPNVKGVNSWSPLSKNDYDNLTNIGRFMEKLYRTPVGICFNYMIERWWKDKFYPYKRIVEQKSLVHWLDFLLVSSYMVLFSSVLYFVGMYVPNTNSFEVLLLGLFIPFIVGNFLIGVTIYQHHTHETIPWFTSLDESNTYVGQEDVTIHIKYPAWYNMISHNAMEHTAHHIDPRVPLYNLSKAQSVLMDRYGEHLVTMDFSLIKFLSTMNKCKLYDYENHVWTDYNGLTTSEKIINIEEWQYANAA